MHQIEESAAAMFAAAEREIDIMQEQRREDLRTLNELHRYCTRYLVPDNRAVPNNLGDTLVRWATEASTNSESAIFLVEALNLILGSPRLECCYDVVPQVIGPAIDSINTILETIDARRLMVDSAIKGLEIGQQVLIDTQESRGIGVFDIMESYESDMLCGFNGEQKRLKTMVEDFCKELLLSNARGNGFVTVDVINRIAEIYPAILSDKLFSKSSIEDEDFNSICSMTECRTLIGLFADKYAQDFLDNQDENKEQEEIKQDPKVVELSNIDERLAEAFEEEGIDDVMDACRYIRAYTKGGSIDLIINDILNDVGSVSQKRTLGAGIGR